MVTKQSWTYKKLRKVGMLESRNPGAICLPYHRLIILGQSLIIFPSIRNGLFSKNCYGEIRAVLSLANIEGLLSNRFWHSRGIATSIRFAKIHQNIARFVGLCTCLLIMRVLNDDRCWWIGVGLVLEGSVESVIFWKVENS